MAERESIVQQPLEGPPAGVDLDRALQPSVVADVQIGVAPAHVGDDDGILLLQRLEQVAHVVTIRRRRRVEQHARGAADGAPLGGEEHVAIAAHAGVA